MARGKDGLYRRGRNFAFRYKDGVGVWRERSTGTDNRADARCEKKKFLDLVRNNQVPTSMALRTVRQAAILWLDSVKDELDRNTIRSYRTCLNPVMAFLGNRKLGSIQSEDLRAYRCHRKHAGRENRTINHEVLCFSYVLKAAKLWSGLAGDYKPLSEGKRHSCRRPLTAEQFNRLVTTAMGNPEWEVVLYLALVAANTTCRPCEIRGLQLERIRLDGAYPTITISRVTTKTNAGEREIPLNRIAQLAIRRLLERAAKLGACRPEHYLLPADLSKHTKPTDPLYFRRHQGFDPNLHQRDWDTSWAKLRAKAGLPGVKFYQLRHTSITTGAEEAVPLAVMKSLAGHVSEDMVEYYTTVRDNPKAKAVAAIENANPELLKIFGLDMPTSEAIQ